MRADLVQRIRNARWGDSKQRVLSSYQWVLNSMIYCNISRANQSKVIQHFCYVWPCRKRAVELKRQKSQVGIGHSTLFSIFVFLFPPRLLGDLMTWSLSIHCLHSKLRHGQPADFAHGWCWPGMRSHCYHWTVWGLWLTKKVLLDLVHLIHDHLVTISVETNNSVQTLLPK